MKNTHTNHICKKAFGLLAATLLFLPNPVHAAENRLPNTQEMNLGMADISIEGREIYIDNARALSDTTNFEDYLKLHYRLYPKTHNILPKAIDVIKGVGIYHSLEQFFIKDPATPISIVDATGIARPTDVPFTATFNKNASNSVTPITLQLSQGSSLSITGTDWNAGFELRLTHVGTGEQFSQKYPVAGQSGTFFYYPRIPIFRSGKYYLRLIPLDQSSLTTNLVIEEANAGRVQAIQNNQSFGATFDLTSGAYVKTKVRLRADDCVVFSVRTLTPTTNQGYLTILGSDGRLVSKGYLESRNYNYGFAATVEDDYYFILHGSNVQVGGTTYVTTVTRAWADFQPNIWMGYLGK
ncbi:MAG TPA: hypothetical protein VNQ90_20090 [Chthoniobacteraceae bacterium]|nr:hypothetical protein [Chthoniobacteraceae bacterium]